jgi:hypothetical protein
MTPIEKFVQNIVQLMDREDTELKACIAGFLNLHINGNAPVTKHEDGIKYQLILINYVTETKTLYIVYKPVV